MERERHFLADHAVGRRAHVMGLRAPRRRHLRGVAGLVDRGVSWEA